MAQDVAAAPRAFVGARPVRETVAFLKRAWRLPLSATPGRVTVTSALAAYVAIASAAGFAVAVVFVRWPADWATLAAGSIATFLMAVYSVRSLPQMTFVWSPSVFVNLGLSVTLGPVGAAAAAVAEAVGVAIRTRNGWFRTTFNLSNHFLSNVAAFASFAAVEHHAPSGPLTWPAAGLAAGVAQFLVNHALLIAVVRISDPDVNLPRVLRNSLNMLPYSIGYGFGAFAFVVMTNPANRLGMVGFIGLLSPLILLQGYLVLFARRVEEHEERRAALQRDKEELQQEVLETSEAERRKIARDLHDGVVQDLAGMAFALSAEAARLTTDPGATNGSTQELVELLESSAKETRNAMKDLRTLIIELAPPTLRREGLHAALLEVLADIKRQGTSYTLDLPANLRLREDRAKLIFRVAHEILRNVAAHAQAKHVTVELTTQNRAAILRIRDDGKGFSDRDVARRRSEGHLGTQAIEELAEEAGGALTIESEPGRGTLVVLTVPIG